MIDGICVGCAAPPGNTKPGFLLRVRLLSHESYPTPAVSYTCKVLLRKQTRTTYTSYHLHILHEPTLEKTDSLYLPSKNSPRQDLALPRITVQITATPPAKNAGVFLDIRDRSRKNKRSRRYVSPRRRKPVGTLRFIKRLAFRGPPNFFPGVDFFSALL